MPDLARSSVLTWLAVQETDKPDLLKNPVMAVEAHAEVDTALTRDSAGLADSLRTGATGADLRTVMGQLGVPRILCLIDWIMQGGLPEASLVLGAVLAPDPDGNGQFIQAMLSDCVRPPLLERLYAPDRLSALLAACQPSAGLREAA